MSAASAVAWKRAHPGLAALNQKRYRARVREEAIVEYGGKCARCSNENHDDLELDHAGGGGNEQRHEIFGHGHASPGGWNFYLWLKKQGWPKDLGLQLLCVDCHTAKDRVKRGRR